ncbi:MAG: universal stress protein [Candidatus Cloacimonetes bacterium]|nr:universal stress protein [Candidatus Cloacimonadota bacterium]
MIKSILVGLDSSENQTIVRKYAVEIAKFLKAKVNGVHVIDIRKLYSPFVEDIFYSAGMASVPDLQNLVKNRLEKVSEVLKEGYQAALEEHEVEGEFFSKQGNVSEEIANQAKSHDLLVIGTKGEHTSISEILLGSTFSELILGVNKPVIVVPEQCKKFYIKKILVAYDGSTNSNQALEIITQSVKDHQFELEILVVENSNIEDAQSALQEAECYLKNHEVKYNCRIVKGPACSCILEHAKATKCDMIAIGSYSSSAIKDFFIGSVARELLEETTLPMLLAN